MLKTLIITDNCVEHGPTILPQQQQEEQQQHELQTELCSGPGHNAIFLRATNQSLISFSYKVQVIDSRYESIVWTLTELWLFALLSLSLSLPLLLSPSRYVVVVTLIAFRAQLVSEHLSA